MKIAKEDDLKCMVNIVNAKEDSSMDVYFKSVNFNQRLIENEFNLNGIELLGLTEIAQYLRFKKTPTKIKSTVSKEAHMIIGLMEGLFLLLRASKIWSLISWSESSTTASVVDSFESIKSEATLAVETISAPSAVN